MTDRTSRYPIGCRVRTTAGIVGRVTGHDNDGDNLWLHVRTDNGGSLQVREDYIVAVRLSDDAKPVDTPARELKRIQKVLDSFPQGEEYSAMRKTIESQRDRLNAEIDARLAEPDPPLIRTGQGDYVRDWTPEPETAIAEDDHDAAGLLFESAAVAMMFFVAAFVGGLVGGVVWVWWLAG